MRREYHYFYVNLQSMDAQINNINVEWSKNIILVDADYIDKVVFNLTVYFENEIGRRLPRANLARWLDCVALDGGIREGNEKNQVIFVHGKDKNNMENFNPSNYEKELNGMAFKDHLGEFMLSSFPIEDIVDGVDFFVDILQNVCKQPNVKRVMVIPNAESEEIYESIRNTLHFVEDDSKRITVFTMQPMLGGNFRQEILGYSVLKALGIKSEEIK